MTTMMDTDLKKFAKLVDVDLEPFYKDYIVPIAEAEAEDVIKNKLYALSPYRRGLLYERALSEGLYASIRALGRAVKGDQLRETSRCLALARLPKDVLAAIDKVDEMRLLWGAKLVEKLLRDPDLVLARAKEIIAKRNADHKISAMAAYKDLIA
jgi:hypothetical protein